ncbi:NAD(+) synthase [Candidatus Gottesmanbacteria bacterium RIFCSPLOWO2_01_FULL_46_9]|uniref:NH(3)-dependent NAD(+) synthetase n=1 Tax=Candidatus Gottesmanbacteria bacterium RIFCSPLOWO2_01_FULL_46_9 TaxID=1798394 RepID=A0A1F6B189_9BACT|nr:MAG: NAD(+) synthase [Candidatus Gottesmanbacteria bacterium RIFCSPLOWO2_01_FULL_46_9]
MKRIDAKKTVKDLVEFVKISFQKEGYTKALVGLSGGVDSATSCALVVAALGKNNVYPVLMPYGSLNNQGTKDAKIVINWLHLPKAHIHLVDMKPMVDAAASSIDQAMDEGRKGNIMVRMRMIVLFDLSKKMRALVVGTENRTEHLLGYYTRFGDEASDVEPLRHLYKTQVYELASLLKLPNRIITKVPTAGLWVGQTDEGEFGFTYKEVDEVLLLHVDKHLSKKEILAKGYDPKMTERIWWWILKGSFKDRTPLILESLRLV